MYVCMQPNTKVVHNWNVKHHLLLTWNESDTPFENFFLSTFQKIGNNKSHVDWTFDKFFGFYSWLLISQKGHKWHLAFNSRFQKFSVRILAISFIVLKLLSFLRFWKLANPPLGTIWLKWGLANFHTRKKNQNHERCGQNSTTK